MLILKGDPWETLSCTHIQIGTIQCIEQEFSWVTHPTREMSETGIAQSPELRCEIFLAVPFGGAQREGRCVCAKELYYSPCDFGADVPLAFLYVRKHRLRKAKQLRGLEL